MKIKYIEKYKVFVVLDHIFKTEEIKLGSKWLYRDGSQVSLSYISDLGDVGFHDEKSYHERGFIDFQDNYKLIVSVEK